ncbi:MAG: radical SAM family heme chaperone HemW [Pseudomonadota bacterium]|nr:radical SAM family heme chaperone HemW [Pseudomonadota bacterium]
MKFGVYVHIPYCVQRCSYCDFATYKQDEIIPSKDYLDILRKEISDRSGAVPYRIIETVYFGGGTPSLLDPSDIQSILECLSMAGFLFSPNIEITLEANPGTVSEKKLLGYVNAGVNRISVGAQTFDAKLLKDIGRFHSPKDTEVTLSLLRAINLNYSFDLLFALPNQTQELLAYDLEKVLEYQPPHLSPYCLTLPKNHKLQINRPSDDRQIEMFNHIDRALLANGYSSYEISNYAKPGFESRHNQLYWDDSPYWGVGLSSHSYFKQGSWGTRFWNPSSIEEYEKQVARTSAPSASIKDYLEPSQYEDLKIHEALSDYCYTFLRTARGLSEGALRCKFGDSLQSLVTDKLRLLLDRGLVSKTADTWFITSDGKMISNHIFENVHFTASCINR